MKKLVLMGQKGFNQLPEVQTIPIGYTNEEMSSYMQKQSTKCNNCDFGLIEQQRGDYIICPKCNGVGYTISFPELKFKNGDFER